jgi:hypothetical protein
LIIVAPQVYANNFGNVYQFKLLGTYTSQSVEIPVFLRENCFFFAYHPTTANDFFKLIFTPDGTTGNTIVKVQFIFPGMLKRVFADVLEAVAEPSMFGVVIGGVVLSLVAIVGYVVSRRQ